jgi:hypothetical protein
VAAYRNAGCIVAVPAWVSFAWVVVAQVKSNAVLLVATHVALLPPVVNPETMNVRPTKALAAPPVIVPV